MEKYRVSGISAVQARWGWLPFLQDFQPSELTSFGYRMLGKVMQKLPLHRLDVLAQSLSVRKHMGEMLVYLSNVIMKHRCQEYSLSLHKILGFETLTSWHAMYIGFNSQNVLVHGVRVCVSVCACARAHTF